MLIDDALWKQVTQCPVQRNRVLISFLVEAAEQEAAV